LYIFDLCVTRACAPDIRGADFFSGRGRRGRMSYNRSAF